MQHFVAFPNTKNSRNQHGGREYDDLQILLHIWRHMKNPYTVHQNFLRTQISKNDVNPRSKYSQVEKQLLFLVFDWRLVKILILLLNIWLVIDFFLDA